MHESSGGSRTAARPPSTGARDGQERGLAPRRTTIRALCCLLLIVTVALPALAQQAAHDPAGLQTPDEAVVFDQLGLNLTQLAKTALSTPADNTWLLLPSAKERVDACEDLSPLYSEIPASLSAWGQDGINRTLFRRAIREHTPYLPPGYKGKDYQVAGPAGMTLGFYKGKAYVPEKPLLHSGLGYHATILLVYLKVMILLEQLFGTELPDVEFVISTIDRPITPPSHILDNATTPTPVFRFCKTPAYPDLLVPNFHSYMKAYTAGVRGLVSTVKRESPWTQRDEVLFGRFTPYLRYLHPADPHAQRKGFKGQRICVASNKSAKCEVRSHLCAWSTRHSRVMDISCVKRTSMARHAQHKYLLHLDGQGLSSRFEQLLYLGSLVFKEESGYIGYFYHLLKPNEHYLPVWREGPEDILSGLRWARAHDEQARGMGEAAQKLAVRYLGPKGKACYWLNLLRQYASKLRYQPGPPQDTATTDKPCTECTRDWVPALTYVTETLLPFLNERTTKAWTFMP